MKSLTKQTYTVALSALMIVFTLTLAGSSYANWQGKNNTNDPELESKRELVHEAIESGDYEAFKSAIETNEKAQEKLSVITADNFDRFSEAHQLMREGREKIEAGQAILKELGIERSRGQKGDWRQDRPHQKHFDELEDKDDRFERSGRRGFGQRPSSDQNDQGSQQ